MENSKEGHNSVLECEVICATCSLVVGAVGDKKCRCDLGKPVQESHEKELKYAFGFGATVAEACYYVGVSIHSYRLYCNKNPEFSRIVTTLKHSPIFKAKKAVVEGFEDDPRLALKYLEKKLPDEFGNVERKEITITQKLDPEGIKRIESLRKEINAKLRESNERPQRDGVDDAG